MLDSETKRRIDTCRDILVGKVPDPKSQVEQITVALIYKFMDDMDLQSEEMGGKRKFFTGDFERYSWAKLVAPGVSGQDMLNTYSEALTKMVENDKLPALFRSIFRNAYLPYRDPETLRSFLREINTFTYDHSEKLGDAFEYLLSVLGSQGDAGQFRTPRHIIDFMVDIIAPKKDEVILDPACGTAGFLISAYKHILKANSTAAAPENGKTEGVDAAELALESPMRFAGDLLSAKDRERLARNIKGYDISPDMVRLSLVNLYLHGFADPKVEEYDTLTSEDKWTEMADVIFANPPFMSPKGGIKPHTRFKVESKRSEVLFVDYIAEHLTPNGRAAIVVPEGIIFQSQTAYVQLRKMLVENFLAAVISLPAGVFNPYSGVKTSILILDRAVAKASDYVAFFKIENDGFQLGAQRKAQKGSQLPQLKSELSAWLEEARTGAGEALGSHFGNAVERERIAEASDYNLSAERYREEAARPSRFEYHPLQEFCELAAGNPAPQADKYFDGGTLPFVRTSDVGQVRRSLGFTGSADKLTREAVAELRLREFPAGTILFPKSGASTFLNHRVMLAEPAYVSSHLACITPSSDRALPQYVYHMLCRVDARDLVPDQAYPSLRLETLGQVEIPLPPLEVQREIVAEIEGYQRVIDGARVVIDSYKPQFSIDSAWPVVHLKDVVRFQEGPGILAKDFVADGVPLVRLAGVQTEKVTLEGCNFLDPNLVASKWPHFRLNKGDILVSTSASFGKVSVVSDDAVGALFYTGLIRFWPENEIIHAGYLRVFLASESFLSQAAAFTAGAVIKHFGPTHLKQMKIPVPPPEMQDQIADDIDAERGIVAGNKELIARFEKKIDAAIARVWGEAKQDAEPA